MSTKRKLLVGYRFAADAPVRAGFDSIVVDAVPISGPIYLSTVMLEDKEQIATCIRCQAQSPIRKRVTLGGAIMQWAHAHRCRP